MSQIVALGTYCRRMSQADHRDDCPSLGPLPRPRWRLDDDLAVHLDGFTPAPPVCLGCVTPADRELWAQLADDIDEHLEAGDAGVEPLF